MKKKHVFWTYLGLWLCLFISALEGDKFMVALNAHELKQVLEIVVGALDIGSAVAVALLAVFAYHGAQRDDDWITVVVRYPDEREPDVIKDAFQREECSRSEVSGLLGAIHGPGRYTVAYLRSDQLIQDIKRIKSSDELELVIPILESDTFGEPEPKVANVPDERPLAFWNISNHPVAEHWSERQIEEARVIAPNAELIDIPFPQVDPTWSFVEVQKQAESLVNAMKIKSEGEHRVAGAMVAGEPIMCQAIVRGLEKLGIPCFSATTRREATQEGSEKRSRFAFVRFRAFSTRGEG